MRIMSYTFIVFCMFSLVGCAPNPVDAFKLSPDSLKQREAQTRVYHKIDEGKILASAAAVLQDMGYTLSESETRLGVITATKEADAHNAGQVALAVLGALFGGGAAAIDDKQRFTVTLVSLPKGSPDSQTYSVRMTMQRVVWNTQGQVTLLAPVNDPEVYKTFFEKLNKSVFLEKNL